MALFVYRFRLKTPILETQLEAEVGVSVAVDDYAGGAVIDIECDDSRAQDLQDAMESRGYEFVEGSPATTAAQGFRSGNSIVGVEEHKVIRQLIHFVDEGPAEGFASGAYKEIVGGLKPTSITWYTDSGKTNKIVEELITWVGNVATTIKSKIYDIDGSTVLWTMTDTVTYSGLTETSRSRAIVSGDA